METLKYHKFNIMLVGVAKWFEVVAVDIDSAMADMREAYGPDIERLTYSVREVNE